MSKTKELRVSMQRIAGLAEEVDRAIGNEERTIADIDDSLIKELLGGAAGMTAGGAASLATLFFAGKIGLSAAGITSGLSAAGSIVGGGMVAGIGILAAPAAILGIAGYGIVSKIKKNKLKEAANTLLRSCIQKHDALIRKMKEDIDQTKERAEYLNKLNSLLNEAIIVLDKKLA